MRHYQVFSLVQYLLQKNEKLKLSNIHGSYYVSRTDYDLSPEACESILHTHFHGKREDNGRLPVNDDNVWFLYAKKQRRYYVTTRSTMERKVRGENTTGCYGCGACLSFYPKEGEEEKEWYSTPLLDGCKDIMNYRICCRKCHEGAKQWQSMALYVRFECYSKQTSLAVREDVNRYVKMLQCYYHKYALPLDAHYG